MPHFFTFRRGAALLVLLLFAADIQAQKVGIGTTTPDSTLTVQGGARFRYGVQVGDYALPAQKGAPGELLLTDPAGGAPLRWSTGLSFAPGLGLTTGVNQPLAPVTVGTANLASFIPFLGLYTDMRSVALLRAADLTAAGLTAGPLLGLDLEVIVKSSTQPYRNFTVQLGATALTALTNGPFPAVPLTTVYSGDYTTALGWNSLPFSQPFVWDGTSNLLVQTCFDNTTTTASDQIRARTTSYVAQQVIVSSGNSFAGCAAPSANSTSQVPICRFTPGSRGYVLPASSPLPGQVLVGGPATGTGPDPAVWTSALAYTPGVGLTVGDPASATAVVVGTQDQTQADPFVSGSFTDARYQYLLRASELIAAGVAPGPLTSVATQLITKNTTGAFSNVVVRIGATALTALASGPFVAAPATVVYTGSYTTAVGWNEIPFAQPFVWDGTSNLLLQYCFDNAATVGPFDVVAHRSTSYGSQLLEVSTTASTVGCDLAVGSSLARLPVFRFSNNQVPYTLPAAGGKPDQVLTQTAVGQTAWRDLPWRRIGPGLADLYRPTGRVGIGTAPTLFKLEVASTDYWAQRLTSSNAAGTWLNLTNTSAGGGGFQFISTGAANGEGPNKLLIYPGTDGGVLGVGLAFDGATRNLGIGVSAPAQKLHVLGAGQFEAGAGALRLVGAGPGSHVYQEWFPEGIANGRKAWLGYGANGNTTLTLTNEYPSGALELATNNTTRLRIAADGDVGIGTTPTAFRLEVASTDLTVQRLTSSNTAGTWLNLTNTSTGGGGFQFISTGAANGEGPNKLLICPGTGGSVLRPGLVLDGATGLAEFFGGANLTSTYAFFAFNGASPVSGNAINPSNVSIRASGRVVATEFNATSDRRLKTIVGLTDNAADLALLNQLRITDYQMRDRATFGDRRFKKVIAQEVEAVFPQAVLRQTGFLPDIYAVAAGARAEADSLLTLTLPAALPEGATVGQRLKLIGPAGEVIGTVARAAGAGARTLTVRSAQTLAATPAEIFVFGLEHPDVRAVDYEALSMLNVSATQELARKVELLEKQNATLQARATQADADHASLLTLQAQLARLLGEATPAPTAQARK